MSLLFLDGVDSYHTIGGALYGVSAPNIGYTISQTSSGDSQVTIGPGTSTSSRAFAIGRSLAGSSRVSKQIAIGGTKFVIGFAMNATGRQSILKLTNLFEVLWPSNGLPVINGVAGPTIPILNTWYYWEFVVDKVAKTVDVWLNGYQQFQSTFTADVPSVVEMSWGWNAAGDVAAVFIDDIYVLDDTSTGSNSKTARLGPIQIATRLPTSTTHSEWAPTPSSKESWKIVSQIPALQNEYVESNVIGAYDLYASSTTVTAEVIAVAVSALTAKTDIDQHAISLVMSNGNTVVEGAPIDLSTQYTYVQSVFEGDVNGTPWTPATASAVNFGIKVK